MKLPELFHWQAPLAEDEFGFSALSPPLEKPPSPNACCCCDCNALESNAIAQCTRLSSIRTINSSGFEGEMKGMAGMLAG